MAEKAKVLILSTAYLPHIGGSELAIKNIADRINDFEFHLITARLDKSSLRQERVGNILVFRVGGFFSRFTVFVPKAFLSLAIFLKASSLFKAYDYKLIHVFQVSGAAGASWLLKFFYPKLPLVMTMQEGKNLESQGFLINFLRRIIIKKADYATAISYYLRDYILKIKKDLPTEIIPNGVDLDHFSQWFGYGEMTNLEEELGIKPDDRVVISVSRLVAKNGLDLLIDAIKNVKYSADTKALVERQISNVKCLIIGNGPLEESLRSKVKNLKLDEDVIFVGSVGQDELPKYLKISDVFVRPSRSEGLGSAFLEAMASGVPIIGTKVGGILDFLEDGKTGLFCSLDPADIAEKINIIFEDDFLRKKIVKNARRLVEEKYDWNKIAGEYRNIYLLEFRIL